MAPAKPADENYARIISVMSAFYNPKPLVTVQRYKFYSRFRRPDESISTFVAELRHLAKDCEFGTALENNLRDRLVCGVTDQAIQKRLLSEQDLTFKKAFEISQSHESAAKDIVTLQGSPPQVHQLADSVGSSCYRCGRKGHQQSQCKFRATTCHHCGKVGHIKPVCRSLKRLSDSIRSPSDLSRHDTFNRPNRQRSSESSNRTTNRSSRTAIKQITENPAQNEKYSLFNLPSNTRSPLYVTVFVNKTPLTMEVDTGASFSVVSKATYDYLFSSLPLQHCDVKLKTYTGKALPMFGQFVTDVQYKDQELPLLFIVSGKDGPSLLGRDWIYSLRLDWNTVFSLTDDNISTLLNKYSEVFNEELGSLKGFKAKLSVNDVNPIYCKARPVPYSIRSLVEDQIDKLVQQKIVEPISFSDWAAPIVPIMETDGTIRICGDFKVTVNKVSKLDRYPLPKIEDLFANLSGGISFTKLDLSQAYQQLELDDDSKQYTVINTHRGLFRYNRLPFGILSAPGIFQRTMESLLSGIPKVIIYLDDILITGISEDDHLHNLQLVLHRLETAGLHLKRKKCQFLVPVLHI